MIDNSFLQVLLLLQVFILGILAAVALRYARAHFGPAKTEEHRPMLGPGASLPPEIRRRLLEEAEVKFQNSINHVSSRLNHDLEISSDQINHLVNKLASDIVSGEMEHYRLQLGKLNEQATAEISGIRSEITKHEAEIKAKMAEEIEAEKQRLIKQIDTKLADAVASFLSETLQHNVDLGNQSEYLLQMLEEHKADFAKEVGQDEAPA
jgi:DNA replication initiation complex subunit (GINS family)